MTKTKSGKSPLIHLTTTDNNAIVVVPVNFERLHWCCIIIDNNKSKISFYDSMECFKSALEKISFQLISDVLPKFEVVSINSPLQHDGWNCGVFVCCKLWRYVDDSIRNDVSTSHSFTRRRFDIAQFVLCGKMPEKTICGSPKQLRKDNIGQGEECRMSKLLGFAFSTLYFYLTIYVDVCM